MKRMIFAATAAALMIGAAGAASAQPQYNNDHRGDYSQHRDNDRHDDRRDDRRGGYDNHSRYVRHNEWQRGHRMSQNDWRRGQRVDYRRHHLRAPPRGYEWREVDGNYVMAAIATGLIASIIANSN